MYEFDDGLGGNDRTGVYGIASDIERYSITRYSMIELSTIDIDPLDSIMTEQTSITVVKLGGTEGVDFSAICKDAC